MNLKYIVEIIENKEKINSLKRNIFDKKEFRSSLNRNIYLFEGITLYPLLSFLLFQDIFITIIVVILSSIVHIFLEQKGKDFLMNGTIKKYYENKIDKHNIDKNSDLYLLLNNKYFNDKEIENLKNYYYSLNNIEKQALIKNENFYNYLYQSICYYIRHSTMEEINKNKEKLVDIVLDHLKEEEEKYILNLIKNKIEDNRELKKQNILKMFEEENEEVNIKKKIIQQI